GASETPTKSTALTPLDDGKAWTRKWGTTKARQEMPIASGFVSPVVIRPLPLGQAGISHAGLPFGREAENLSRGAGCAASPKPAGCRNNCPRARCRRPSLESALTRRLRGQNGGNRL